LADQVSKFEGVMGARTGSILASWFLFNPNGPTAYAFGYMEESTNLRFFCRWMHFSGGEIYMLDDVSARVAVSANFAELTMNALISLTNQMAMSGGKSPGLGIHALPSFVMTNGNAEIDKCLKFLMSRGAAAHSTDWGRELYYLKKYGTDLFGRAGGRGHARPRRCARAANDGMACRYPLSSHWPGVGGVENLAP
jgi:hypothetical protein